MIFLHSNLPIPTTPHRLGPLDLLVSHTIPTSVIFVYPPTAKVDSRRLQKAVQCLLNEYPHLTGRLEVLEDSSVVVSNFQAGALYLESTSRSRLLSRPTLANLPGNGNDLLPPWDPSTTALNPLLSIQHTTFACGSVVIGVRLPHIICDGDGFFQVTRNLASLYRGEKIPKPTIESYMSNTPANSTDLSYQPRHFTLEPPITSFTPPARVSGRIMTFSKESLAALKRDATLPNSENWVTTFEALAALIHQSVHRARRKINSVLSPADYLSPINYRSKLKLGENYLANALICAITSFDSDHLCTAPLSEVASTLHRLFRDGIPTPGEAIDTLRWVQAQPDKSKISTHFRYGSGSLMLSSWSKFDMYSGMDLGALPNLVTLPFTPITMMDGLGYFLPVDSDSGSIDVNLALNDEVWGRLEEDALLNGYITKWSTAYVL